jgi:hypothetical protein
MISDVILMNKKRYGLVDLNEITTAQYMDLEKLLSSSEDMHEVSSSLAAILYRPIKNVKHSKLTRLVNIRFKFLKTKFIKPYSCAAYKIKGYDLKESDSRVNEIEESFSWGNAISCLAYYMSWKQDLAKRFFLVFPVIDPEKQKAMEETKRNSMADDWGLYNQLSLITERDLEKIDYYKAQPLTEVMFHLGYCVADNKSREK